MCTWVDCLVNFFAFHRGWSFLLCQSIVCYYYFGGTSKTVLPFVVAVVVVAVVVVFVHRGFCFVSWNFIMNSTITTQSFNFFHHLVFFCDGWLIKVCSFQCWGGSDKIASKYLTEPIELCSCSCIFQAFHSAFTARLTESTLSPEEQAYLLSHIHFVTQSLAHSKAWVRDLLRDW